MSVCLPLVSAPPTRSPGSRRALVALAWIVGAVVLTGCGSMGAAGEDLPRQDARLLLDAEPSGVHAGVYMTASRGYDQGEGVTLRLSGPASSSAVRLLRSERVDAAVMDIHELGLARQRGADLIGVMALVQRPLTAIMAEPPIRAPADLEGRRTALSDDAGERAALRSMVSGDGGDPDEVETVELERDGTQALLTGRVEATLGRWDIEGVAIADERPDVRELRVEDYGAPGYPQLVVVVTRYTLEERTSVVRALIRALQRGYREASFDPESAVAAIREREPELDRNRLSDQLTAVSPAWRAGTDVFGELDSRALRAWADWALEHEALERPLDVGRAFDTSLVSRPQSS